MRHDHITTNSTCHHTAADRHRSYLVLSVYHRSTFRGATTSSSITPRLWLDPVTTMSIQERVSISHLVMCHMTGLLNLSGSVYIHMYACAMQMWRCKVVNAHFAVCRQGYLNHQQHHQKNFAHEANHTG